ncbi:MAG TPA: divalent-cation tolerance protein CutA [Thermoplasmata archaeon]|nr:divalent-cation tolerance protein CutA [Thermoplasmata archaeon]
MSPYPLEPVEATGPMRLVLTAFPSAAVADRAVESVLSARLAACAQATPVHSRYWWKGRMQAEEEVLVVFKTVPKRVGALFRHLAQLHPYDVPEIVEIDVPRVHAPYLAYLADTLDADSPPPPLGGGSARARRPGSRRARGAPSPGRTRGRPRRRY